MVWKKVVADYFTFNKRELIGLFLLLLVITASVLLPGMLGLKNEPIAFKNDSLLLQAIDTVDSREGQSHRSTTDETATVEQHNFYSERTVSPSFTKAVLFPFDPNTITASDWQRLGLNEKTSKTIEKYVSKGGKFYKREDLKKIWGMPEGFYERVKSYVVIANTSKNYTVPTYENKTFIKEEKKLSTVNINDADTAGFIALPGIGSKLSARIISFREKLGGFYSVDQIGETYGLPDSSFQKIKNRLQVDGAKVKKININTATKEELKVHPYIRWNLASAIVEYRTQHGVYKTIDDIKNIVLIDEALFKKLTPYLSL